MIAAIILFENALYTDRSTASEAQFEIAKLLHGNTNCFSVILSECKPHLFSKAEIVAAIQAANEKSVFPTSTCREIVVFRCHSKRRKVEIDNRRKM